MSDVLSREQFLSLCGHLRANSSFPDAPFLAFYDTVTAQLAQVTAERDATIARLKAHVKHLRVIRP
jgi:hypothetical protein